MAIVKHVTSKNSDYYQAYDYLTLKHKEIQSGKSIHYEPVLDENGFTMERENYSIVYVTATGEEKDADLWPAACYRTNMYFGKNNLKGDIKQHGYIISHPKKDREQMTMDDLLLEGREFVRKFLKGYDVLIAVHRDTDNDHIHITLNSIRTLDRDEECWMKRDKYGKTLRSEFVAGGKHQDTTILRRYINDWLFEYTRSHGYTVEDNNAKADLNKELRYGKKNLYLKKALLHASDRSHNIKELGEILQNDYHIELKLRGNTLSVRHPDNQKFLRLRSLGLELEEITGRFITEESVSVSVLGKIVKVPKDLLVKNELDFERDMNDPQMYRLSWIDLKSKWIEYKSMTDAYWRQFDIYSVDYAEKIDEAYEEKYRFSNAKERTLYALETTQSLFVFIFLLIKSAILEILDESIEYEMNKLIKQRKQLIEDASDFKKYCQKYREDLLVGMPPEKRYLNAMNSMLTKLDRYYKSYCINNEHHLSKKIGGDHIDR